MKKMYKKSLTFMLILTQLVTTAFATSIEYINKELYRLNDVIDTYSINANLNSVLNNTNIQPENRYILGALTNASQVLVYEIPLNCKITLENANFYSISPLKVQNNSIYYDHTQKFSQGEIIVNSEHISKENGNFYTENAYIQFTKAGFYSLTITDEENPSAYQLSNTTVIVQVGANNIPKIAQATKQNLFLNENQVSAKAYNIDGNNYYKLRDLAMILNSTDVSFNVVFDKKTSAIMLISTEKYQKVGGELELPDGKNKTGTQTTSTIYKDNEIVHLKAYNIEGNNYFKLRDIAKTFNFNVLFDEKNNQINLDTHASYNP